MYYGKLMCILHIYIYMYLCAYFIHIYMCLTQTFWEIPCGPGNSTS